MVGNDPPPLTVVCSDGTLTFSPYPQVLPCCLWRGVRKGQRSLWPHQLCRISPWWQEVTDKHTHKCPKMWSTLTQTRSPLLTSVSGCGLQLQQRRRRRIREDSLLRPTVLWLWTGGVSVQALRPRSFSSHRPQSCQGKRTLDWSTFTVWPPLLSSPFIWTDLTSDLPPVCFSQITSNKGKVVRRGPQWWERVLFYFFFFLTLFGNCFGGIWGDVGILDLESYHDWTFKTKLNSLIPEVYLI